MRMATIDTGNQYSYSGGGYIAKRGRTDSTDADQTKKAQEEDKKSTPELEAYKQEFVKKIKEKADGRSELSRTRINLDIDNDTFEKMRTDSAYEKKIMDMFNAKVDKKYPLPPVSITVTANSETESVDIDYGQSKEMFANRSLLKGMQKSMLRSNVQSLGSEVLATLQDRLSGGSSQLDLSAFDRTGAASGGFDLYA